MKIKRIIALVLCLVMCGMLFTGCHGSQGRTGFEVPDEFDTSRNYEITFWAKNDTNKTQVEIYEKAVAAFEGLYPNIKVNVRLYTDYAKIYNDVITNISTDTTPNVCISYPDHIATYLTGSDVVVPLDSLAADENYGFGGSRLEYDGPSYDEVVPKFLEECKINGTLYAVPYMRSTEACYINKDFVEALGYTVPDVLTWDFVWEVSEAAMAKEADGETFKINGQKVMIPFIYKSTDNMMIQMLRQKGAGYSTAEGDILIFNDTTRELLYEISKHAKTQAFSTFKISSYPANFLNAGQCIFAVDSTAGATWMGSNAPLSDISKDKIVDFETVVRAVPQFDTENVSMISQGPSICIFNKEDSQEVLASWLFAQFMMTNEVQIAYAKTEGYAPVTTKAQDSAEYQDYLSRSGEDNKEHYDIKIQATELLIANTGNTFTTPVFNGSASLRDAAGQMIENTAKSTRRKETIDEAYMDKLYSDITSLYRLDQINTGGGSGASPADLGPLPSTAVTLLVCLALAWLGIIVYFVFTKLKGRASRK